MGPVEWLVALRIAHNERYRDAAGDWTDRPACFDVTIWSGLGEWIAANVAKGEKVVSRRAATLA